LPEAVISQRSRLGLTKLTAAALFVMAPFVGWAEVADSAANGFTVKISMNIQSTPDEVYRKFVRNVGDWWNPEHTFSGSSQNLSIEERAAGCFCEKMPNGGGVRHLEVVYVAPGKVLVLSGGLGPLQSLGVSGSMTITFSPASGGTKLEVSYAVGGYLAAGLNTWAAPVSTMLTEQFTRLKNYTEHGDPKK
jgi:uncharacterized protein YndB with AHSA1/START domain